MNRIYTSTSLPIWQRARLRTLSRNRGITVSAYLEKLLNLQKKHRIPRCRSRRYNYTENRFVITPVVFEISVYNRLHFIAYQRRMSVSHLIHEMILFGKYTPPDEQRRCKRTLNINYKSVLIRNLFNISFHFEYARYPRPSPVV